VFEIHVFKIFLVISIWYLKYSLLGILCFSILSTFLLLTVFGKYCIQNTFSEYFLIHIICVVCVRYIWFLHLSCVVGNSVEDFGFLIFSNCCCDLNDCLMALCLKIFTMCHWVFVSIFCFKEYFSNTYFIYLVFEIPSRKYLVFWYLKYFLKIILYFKYFMWSIFAQLCLREGEREWETENGG